MAAAAEKRTYADTVLYDLFYRNYSSLSRENMLERIFNNDKSWDALKKLIPDSVRELIQAEALYDLKHPVWEEFQLHYGRYKLQEILALFKKAELYGKFASVLSTENFDLLRAFVNVGAPLDQVEAVFGNADCLAQLQRSVSDKRTKAELKSWYSSGGKEVLASFYEAIKAKISLDKFLSAEDFKLFNDFVRSTGALEKDVEAVFRDSQCLAQLKRSLGNRGATDADISSWYSDGGQGVLKGLVAVARSTSATPLDTLLSREDLQLFNDFIAIGIPREQVETIFRSEYLSQLRSKFSGMRTGEAFKSWYATDDRGSFLLHSLAKAAQAEAAQAAEAAEAAEAAAAAASAAMAKKKHNLLQSLARCGVPEEQLRSMSENEELFSRVLESMKANRGKTVRAWYQTVGAALLAEAAAGSAVAVATVVDSTVAASEPNGDGSVPSAPLNNDGSAPTADVVNDPVAQSVSSGAESVGTSASTSQSMDGDADAASRDALKLNVAPVPRSTACAAFYERLEFQVVAATVVLAAVAAAASVVALALTGGIAVPAIVAGWVLAIKALGSVAVVGTGVGVGVGGALATTHVAAAAGGLAVVASDAVHKPKTATSATSTSTWLSWLVGDQEMKSTPEAQADRMATRALTGGRHF